MATGCSLNSAPRHQEGETPRCSARQNRRTERAFCGPQNARKRCIKKNYDGIHCRFQPKPVYRDSQLKIDWTEEKCIAIDKLAQEDHSYRLSSDEYERYEKTWYLTLKSGKNAPMRLRSDFRTAVTLINRLHRESGEERPEPIPFQQYQGWHPSFSSSSSSWWQWDKKLVELINFIGSFTPDRNLLQPTGCVNSTPHTSLFSRVCAHL